MALRGGSWSLSCHSRVLGRVILQHRALRHVPARGHSQQWATCPGCLAPEMGLGDSPVQTTHWAEPKDFIFTWQGPAVTFVIPGGAPLTQTHLPLPRGTATSMLLRMSSLVCSFLASGGKQFPPPPSERKLLCLPSGPHKVSIASAGLERVRTLLGDPRGNPSRAHPGCPTQQHHPTLHG